jgi:hypothetical protein
MLQELDGRAAGIVKPIAHPLSQFQADSVAGVQVASGFGDTARTRQGSNLRPSV